MPNGRAILKLSGRRYRPFVMSRYLKGKCWEDQGRGKRYRARPIVRPRTKKMDYYRGPRLPLLWQLRSMGTEFLGGLLFRKKLPKK